MGTITRTYDPQTGQTVDAAHWDDLDTIYSEFNGNISNDNIAADADIAVSKTTLSNYTAWTDFTPTLSGKSPMTWNGNIQEARYTRLANTVTTYIYATASPSGSASNGLQSTLPVTPAISSDQVLRGVAQITDNGTNINGFWIWRSSTSLIQIFRYDAANFTLGATAGFAVTITYEV